MKLKLEQKIVAVYLVVGLICAVISNYLAASNLTYAFLTPVIVYSVTLLLLMRIVKEHRLRMLISSSLVTFFLVWIMAWIFLYNL